MTRRVVITGLGVLTPIGSTIDEFWSAIQSGRTGIAPLQRIEATPYHAKCSAEIKNFNPLQYFPKHRLKRMDLYTQYAVCAASLALKDASLNPTPESPNYRFGISFGTGIGGIAAAEDPHTKFLQRGPEALPAALAMQVFGGTAHSNVAILHGIRGYSTTNSNSCASGTVAIGEGLRAIRENLTDVMVCGAAEAPITPLTFGAFDVLKVMSREPNPSLACRPFDQQREGFVMGEGAAALILEERNHALERGAKIYAEVLGYGLTNDAYHMTSSLSCGSSAMEAMRLALDQSGLPLEQIGYINAHASGTPMNDDHEAKAILQLFKSHRPAVSGTKGFTGHPLGAAGAMEAVITTLALKNNYLPVTLGCQNPEIPDGFDLIVTRGRDQKVAAAMNNSFGFGGINSVVVMAQAEGLR